MIGLLALVVVLSAAFLALVFIADSEVQRVGHLTELAPGDGVYLIAGSDSRENLPEDLEGRFGQFDGARTDVIMLVQATENSRQVLSLPRDLLVEIPGHGTQRINAAYELGGPGLLVETVARATGIRPNHYVEVDFAGFAGVVDAVGGIELAFPHPSRDTKTGLNVEAGTFRVDGATALAYARSRQFEEFREGSWVGEETGSDVGRTGRQRTVLLEMIEAAFSPTQLVRAPWMILQLSSNLAIDSELSFVEIVTMAWSMRTAGATETRVLPVKDSETGDGTVIRQEPLASEMLEAFAQRRPLPDP